MQKNQGGDDSDEELPKGSNSIGLEEDELDEDVESSGEEFVAGNTEDCFSGPQACCFSSVIRQNFFPSVLEV